MKSLKPFQYILIAIFFILLIIVFFNVNSNKNPESDKSTVEDYQNIEKTSGYKNIIFNGNNQLYENGKHFASMSFKSLEEKENGFKIIKNLTIKHLNTENTITCSDATIDLENTLNLLGNVILKNKNGNLKINFEPPVIFKNKTMEGNGKVEINDSKSNQKLNGKGFKYNSDKKDLFTYKNTIFKDLGKGIVVKSQSSYSDFNKNTILFLKNVKSNFNNNKNNLETDVLYYDKKKNSFHFSGHSEIFDKSTKIAMANGKVLDAKKGNFSFISDSKNLFNSIEFLGKSDSVLFENGNMMLENFQSTNGIYNLNSPKLYINTNSKLCFGDFITIKNVQYILRGWNYKISNNGNSIAIKKPAINFLKENFNIKSLSLEIKNKKLFKFKDNVNGNFENKYFKCDTLDMENNSYKLSNAYIQELDESNKRELFSDFLKISDKKMIGKGNVVLKEPEKNLNADNLIYENESLIFYGNVKAIIENTNINADKAYFNNSYVIFLNGKLTKGKNYFAKSKVIIWFNDNKIVCIGDALFIDKSNGKATGDSLTLDTTTDTINLRGMKKKAKIEFKYEKKISNK